jgi:hypothetical protein
MLCSGAFYTFHIRNRTRAGKSAASAMLRRGALWANTRVQSLTNDGRHGNACGHVELGFKNNQGTFAGQFGHEEEERLKVFPDSLHQRRDTGLCHTHPARE